MIVSKNWLAEYVQLPESTAEWADRLTMSGLNLEEFHDVAGDTAVDLEVTSNRPDCLGHIGVAREVAVLYSRPLALPEAEVVESDVPVESAVSVSIECPELCHEYHARVIQGVRIGASPAWLRDRLAAVGINSVNNVVDVTNYVMLECGQPLHAFDYDKLNGQSIIVRRASAGERIAAIDQRDYALSTDMCVIADADRPVAVAGVMGGLDTEISDQTRNVLIETASFAPISVRTTARALKLHSPSSYRFERRVDRQQMDWASRRCCQLIQQVAGGQVMQGAVAVVAAPRPATDRIPLRFGRIEQVLGIRIDSDECVRILERLGLQCPGRSDDAAEFVAPSWRPDLSRECDLIEEVVRIHGYDKIPADAAMPVVATSRTRREQVSDTVRNFLTSCGFYESLTLSFVSEQQLQLIGLRGRIAPVAVSHSSRSHENHLRQSLIPSLLQCRRQNQRHGTASAELFELAKVYLSAGQGKPEHEAEPTVATFVSGRPLLQLKGCVEQLVELLAPQAELQIEPSVHEEFKTDRGARLVLNGRLLGWIGELADCVTDALDLQDDVTVAELDFEVLLDAYQPVRTSVPLPRFPAISRDLNFVMPEAVSWRQLSDTVTGAGGELLQTVAFGGQYRGKQIDAACKSYVVSCRFMAQDRTLTAEEVDRAVSKIVCACATDLSAKLRA